MFVEEYCQSEGGVKSQCINYGCRYIISDAYEMKCHLERVGFKGKNLIRTSNGEELPHIGLEINTKTFKQSITYAI